MVNNPSSGRRSSQAPIGVAVAVGVVVGVALGVAVTHGVGVWVVMGIKVGLAGANTGSSASCLALAVAAGERVEMTAATSTGFVDSGLLFKGDGWQP
jgi:hypothetical protein